MSKDEMIEWFKSAPMGSRQQRMLWAARKIAHLTGATDGGAYRMLESALIEAERLDVTGDYTAQNLSARQRDVMKLIVRGLSNKEIASILSLAEGLTAKECLQSAEGCLALAHKTKELDTRAALLEFACEFSAVAKRLERDERKLMVRAVSDGTQKHGV
jgi:hypothetical protein